MNTLTVLVAASAFALINPVVSRADTAPTPGCNPVQQTARTDFPPLSQQRGEHGTVKLNVKIDRDGRAANVLLLQSSGHKTLDRAAVESVRKFWRFDVAQCTAADLADYRSVDIQFQQAPRYTLAGSVNTRIATLEKQLQSSNRCDVARDEAGNAVFACVQNTAEDTALIAQRQTAR